jgi:hypothetical protein
VGCANLKFESLNFSVDVVIASIRSGWFVEKVEEHRDEDEDGGEGIEHRQV